jgi:hypothetical protein
MNMDTARVPGTVKRIVHLGYRGYGRLTAGARMLPSFLICGGQRCGTTSLYRALAAHPLVLKAVLHKGVHYFDTAYHRGPRWYRGHFPRQSLADRIAAEVGVRPLVFESSPYYMYHPHAAARIAADLPGVKLVVLVRDPVQRAYSQHAHELARGFESEPSFRRALALEPARLSGQAERMRTDPGYRSFAHQHHAYRARGEYVRYLEHMARHVGRERILVLESERFFATPEPVYDEVLGFLGLPAAGYPAFAQHNARPRAAAMDERVRRELTGHYLPFDTDLATWLGHTPSWRL